MILITIPCEAFSIFYTYFALQRRTVSKVKMLLLVVIYTILILATVFIPFVQEWPILILRFLLYSIELFLYIGLLTVTGERNLKQTMFYTLFSYLLWYLLPTCTIGITYFLIGRWVPAVYILCIMAVLGCFLLIGVVRLANIKYNLRRIVKYLEDRVDTWSKMIVLYLGFIIFAIIIDIMSSMEEGVNVVNLLTHPLALVGFLLFLRRISARITMEEGPRDQTNKLWYFQVPQEYVTFEKIEILLFKEDAQQWEEIVFMRPPWVPKFWKAGQSIDAFSSANFLQQFFWNLKAPNEKIEIRIPEETKLFDGKFKTKIETKEELFETMEYIATYGTECGIVYHTDEKVKRMIRFQPAELMYIYISEEDVPTIKEYLSKYGEETSYNAYHLDELND